MVSFVRGDVIVIPFPFSDLSDTKRRPALVVATVTRNNVILCQITSQNQSHSEYAIKIEEDDIENGSLQTVSYAQTDVIFTAASKNIIYKIGNLTEEKLNEISTTLVKLVKGEI